MAVFGIFGTKTSNVASSTYYGLYSLQHRGQASAGIVVCDDGVFHSHKDSGIVNDVFSHRVLQSLGEGQMALGNVRYGTSHTRERVNAEPMVINHIKGRMAIAHNGKLVNYGKLRSDLEMSGAIFHTSSDAEVISYMITKERVVTPSIEEAVNKAMYSLYQTSVINRFKFRI